MGTLCILPGSCINLFIPPNRVWQRDRWQPTNRNTIVIIRRAAAAQKSVICEGQTDFYRQIEGIVAMDVFLTTLQSSGGFVNNHREFNLGQSLC